MEKASQKKKQERLAKSMKSLVDFEAVKKLAPIADLEVGDVLIFEESLRGNFTLPLEGQEIMVAGFFNKAIGGTSPVKVDSPETNGAMRFYDFYAFFSDISNDDELLVYPFESWRMKRVRRAGEQAQ